MSIFSSFKDYEVHRRQIDNPHKKLLLDAENAQKKGRVAEAVERYNKVLAVDPTNHMALNNLSLIYIGTANFDLAEDAIMKIMATPEADAATFNHLAIVYMRTSRLLQATKLLEHALTLDPFKLETFLNLANAFGLLKEFNMAFHYALEAIKIEPTSSFAFNNLGTVLSGMAKYEEAQIAYQTAAELDPNNLEAFVNLGSLQVTTGQSYLAIETYEKAMSKVKKAASGQIDVIKFLLSFEYLKAGNLKKGWDYYDSGFHPSVPVTSARVVARTFKKPIWKGQPIPGKTLLLWREQGLGDEILFMSCVRDLLKIHPKIILEVDKRLVETIQRSFPTITVRAQNYGPPPQFAAVMHDYDYHLPLGSLMRYLRPTLAHFETSGPFVQIDDVKKTKFAGRLKAYKGKTLVGICWRSGTLDPTRARGYTSLMSWSPLFKLDNVVWVNLQYGECEQECQAAEEAFGIEIVRWNDLDLKDDLDDVFALMSELDVIVTAATAVHHMGAAVGAETVLLAPRRAWNRFGLDHDPWFANLHPILINQDDFAGSMEQVKSLIEQDYIRH